MLLKLGAAMMLIAATLAVGVTAVVNLGPSGEASAPAEPVASTESAPPETTMRKSPAERPRATKERGAKDEPVTKDEPRTKNEPGAKDKPRANEGAQGRQPEKGEAWNAAAPPVADWPAPEPGELDRLDGPRDFGPSPGAEMTLTIEALDLADVPVDSSDAPAALDNGVVHVPGASLPGDGGAQRNVYLAGHRLGYPGTGSRMVFFNLDKLAYGDTIVLKDRSGAAYEYEVSEIFVVDPNADWAMDPVRDRDMVTLQTCTYPDFENRIIVRADRARAASMS